MSYIVMKKNTTASCKSNGFIYLYTHVIIIFVGSLFHPAGADQRLSRFVDMNDPNEFVNLRGAIVNIVLTCYEKPPLHYVDPCQATDFSSLQTPDFKFIEATPPEMQGLNAIFTKTPLSRQGANVQRISDVCSYSDGKYKILYIDKNIQSDQVAICTLQAILMFLGFEIPLEENGNINSAFFHNVVDYYTSSQ